VIKGGIRIRTKERIKVRTRIRAKGRGGKKNTMIRQKMNDIENRKRIRRGNGSLR
jgi:hypothetical protein